MSPILSRPHRSPSRSPKGSGYVPATFIQRTRTGGMLALCFAGWLACIVPVAEAQTTTVTYVSNTGQGSTRPSTSTRWAQNFTTGSQEGGYPLTTVKLNLQGGRADEPISISVCTVNSSGQPTTTCTALNPPASFPASGSETHAFTAPANTVLAASTTYALDIRKNVSSQFSATGSDNEDSAESGWSIGDTHLNLNEGSWRTNEHSLRIAIEGMPLEGNVSPTAADGSVTTDEDTSYAFTATDFGFSDGNASDSLASVKVATLPANGELRLDDTALTSGDLPQTVSATELSEGDLTFVPPENANGASYASFTFRVNDGTIDSALTYTMTLNVTAVNDAPVVANALADQTATQGTAFEYVVPANTFSDVDSGDSLTYSFTAATSGGGNLHAWLAFDATSRTFSGTPTDAGTVQVEVKATDSGGDSVSSGFDIVVGLGVSTAVNLSVGTPSLSEGAAANSITVTATLNGVARDTVTPVVVAVSSGTATEGTDFANVADFTINIPASTRSHNGSFSLDPTDDGIVEQEETVSVSGSTTVEGLTVNGTQVAITDNDTRGVTVSKSSVDIGEGNTGSYTIALDTQPTGTVTVTPTSGDIGAATVSAALTFTASNWATQQTVTVTAVQDEDFDDEIVTVTHAVSGADYASVTAGDVTVNVDDDEIHTLTARFTNVPQSHNGKDTFWFELHFSENVNLSASAFTNGLLTITGGTLDHHRRLVGGDNTGWRIQIQPEGNDDVTVTLPANTVACNLESAPCSKVGDRPLTAKVMVTVPGPNTAPQVTGATRFTVQENQKSVATLTATDAESQATALTWSIPAGAAGGPDGGKFTLSTSGALAFAAAKDFEAPDDNDANGSYAVTVQVSDGRLTDTASLTVVLTNVNEAPTADAGPDQFAVQPGATVTLSGSGSDPDADDDLEYLWTRTSGPTGTLSNTTAATATFLVPAGTTLPSTFTFTLRVTDEASLSDEDTMSVTVGGQAPGAPAITSATTFSVAENQTTVATLTATDADTQASGLTWSIPPGAAGGPDGGKFTLSSTGVLKFKRTKDFENADDADNDGSYQVTVQVSDGTQRARASLTVTLTNVNEAPIADAGADQLAVSSGETVTLSGVGSDPDANDSVSHLWTRTAGPQVNLTNASTATATFTAPTVNQPTDLTFNYRATDTGSLYDEDTMTVKVHVPLTAAFEDAPSNHDGSTEFSLKLRFSENVDLSAGAFRNGMLTITNGTLRDQRRLISGSSILWEIDVQPSGVDDDVTITLPANQACGRTAAPCTLNGRRLSAQASVTVLSSSVAGAIALTVDPIAGDDIVNFSEKTGGFSIAGDTGSVGGASVTVTVVGTDETGELTTTSSTADPATWSVRVPGNVRYVEGASVAVEVTATKPNYRSATEQRSVVVDLVIPSVTYNQVPLKVGVPITPMRPVSVHTDIVSYTLNSGSTLPSGLSLDPSTGVVTGTPDTAGRNSSTVNATVTDLAGNTYSAFIAFPATTAKGDQDLTGFSYSAGSAPLEGTAPTLTAPTGAQGSLTYSAEPATVCTVNSTSGALTLVGVGECTITATAASTDNYNEGSTTFRLVVQGDETLQLTLSPISFDNTINIDEKARGFRILGNTGTESGVNVVVDIGDVTLTAISRIDSNLIVENTRAIWLVNVPANASYITGASVEITVSASKAGYNAPDDITHTLNVDLVAPTAPTYTAPPSLQVGVAMAAIQPGGGSDIVQYLAIGLPSGLNIDFSTGVVSGTPDEAVLHSTDVTVSVQDAAGNFVEANIVFPAVDKGDQTLSGFRYSVASVRLGSPAPALIPPTGTETTLSYSASPPAVCTVNASTGALSLLSAGECVITATAAGTANWNETNATWTVTVQPAGTLALNLGTISDDDTINIAEKAAGFTISGDTGTEADVAVKVTIGTTELTATSTDVSGTATWSVYVPADASYITGTSVTATVSASKAGFTAPDNVTRTLNVDLTAPTAPTWSAPGSLQVGVAMTAIQPGGGSGVDEYSAVGLPAGLGIDPSTGAISGTPERADTNTTNVTVTVSDTAGNSVDAAAVAFPAVAKGNQTLSGFRYSAASVTLSSPAPTLTPPSGARTTLIYWADPAAVCTIDPNTGALTLLSVGDCVVTATATSDANWNQANATWTITVQGLGNLVLNLDTITDDDTINIAEKVAGFAISGDTGTEADAAVTVTVGVTELTATSADVSGTATWSVNVPANAFYITGTSVEITVSASKDRYTTPGDVTRTLNVDLTAPTAPTWTAPATLQVGVAMTAIQPTGGSGIDEYSVVGLPAGLRIDASTGVISGTPTAANTSTAAVTVTVEDTAGNSVEAAVVTFPAVEGLTTAIDLSVDPPSLAEDAAATGITVTATLNGATRASVTPVVVAVGSGSATEGTDFADVADFTINIPANTKAHTGSFSLDPTDDGIVEGEETVSVSGSTTVEGLTVNGTQVAITDNDTRGVEISSASLDINEGNTGSYTVALDTQPTGAVTVTPASGDTGAATVSGVLTFTTSNWATRQTVTVTAVQDEDGVDETVTVTHAVAGADYASVSAADVTVNVTDDEEALTAVLSTTKQRHTGRDDLFWVQLDFTPDDVALNATAFSNGLLTIEGGTLAGTPFFQQDIKIWYFQIRPAGAEDVTITLPANRPCNANRAPCTRDDPPRRLSAEVMITVPGLYHSPQVTSARSFTVRENQTTVATLRARDTDTPTADLTWSIPAGAAGGTDGGKFTLSDSGALAFAAAKNFEAPDDDDADGSYAVTVQVSDGSRTDTAALTVTLTNVNESPTADAGPNQFAVQPGATVTLSGTGSDPDAGDNLAFRWRKTAGPAGTLSNATNATATFAVPIETTEPSNFTFTLRVTDQGNLSHEDTMSVTVGGQAPGTPTITSATAFSVAENQTAVATLTATDSDTQASDLTWSIPGGAVAGADDARFSLSSSGVLVFKSAKDFENADDADSDGSYQITVQVSDGAQRARASLTVTLTNVNEAPTADAGADQLAVSSGETVTLRGTGSDQDANDTLSHLWTRTAGPQVTLTNAGAATATFTAPTVSQETDFTFNYRVTDSGSLSDNDTMAVKVHVPLTAAFESAPSNHDGSTVFSVRLRFSENVNLSANAFRNGMLTITNGVRTNQRRVTSGSNIAWEIDVRPSSANEDVTITLPANLACNPNSAPCTQGENPRRLSAEARVTILRPSLGAITISLDTIADDDTINIAEKAAGFTISGDTGTEADAAVTVAIGSTSLTATSADQDTTDSDDTATWSVNVPAAASYITGASVEVTVSASKAGYKALGDVTRTLNVDLTAPTAPTWTAPPSLQVGVAMTAIEPTGGSGIDEYSATGLPAGLSIDASTGAISGTPTAANTSTTAVTVTVEDTAGNAVDAAVVTFPVVAKGNQTLSGFQYSATSVRLDATVPTVTPPSGAETTLTYSASPATVCTVNATSGALTLVGVGECDVTATAASDANWNQAAVTWAVTVQALGNLMLNVGTIADDNTVNIAEKVAGFAISGDTGTEAGVAVTVAIGTASLTTTSAEESGTATWSVDVPAAASYISGTSVTVTVSASKNGFTAPGDVTRTLTVDLTAPTAPTYTAPPSLQVGVAMTAIQPSGGSSIDDYSVSGLPAGLSINASTGAISGTPTAANTSTAAVTVTVEDTAGNAVDAAVVTFPVVAKGDQTLSGFQYSATSVRLDATVPTVTPPTGVETTLSYSASPPTVCTVNATSGALTLVGAGECVVTATAAGNANWNQAAVTWTVTVQALGNLVLNVGTIADDNTVNIAEKAAGFAISGDTGTETGVAVAVAIGTASLTVTSAEESGTATWSVDVPAAASYITGTSVTVTVSASKNGFTAPGNVTRTLTVDLTAPTAPTWTAPPSLQVGVAMTAIQPSGGSGIDDYSVSGLPAGLSIDASTGAISGTPTAANTSTAAVTVTVEDTAGNAVDAAVVTFPVVAKGNQTLSGFQYSATSVRLDATVPTVTTPSGVETTLSYSASPSTVCTVNATSGTLTLVGVGECVVTATAAGDANWNQAAVTWTVTVQALGNLVLNVGTIADDNTVNIAEKAAGFTISGDTGTETGVTVTVAIGTASLTATSAEESGTATWSVNVPVAASYITGTSVTVTVSASKNGFTAPGNVTRALTVDLTAPTAPTYTTPPSLQVGVAMTAIEPTGGSGIDDYSVSGLPAGLSIDASTGAISGTPTTANTSTAAVTVTVEDTAGNAVDAAVVTFPLVAKGDQTLSGFQYSATSVRLDATVPTVTPPTGTETTLSYSASLAAVCTVDAISGALTLVGVGECVVTATAAGNANWNQAAVTWTVTVQALGNLVLNVGTIADDNTVNIAEQAAGFTISGDTGTETGVAVTVAIGTASLTATSAEESGTAVWSVNVPADASYITGTSLTVTVSASKNGFTAPGDVTRTLTVDLTAPTAPTYTAPPSLQVGVAMTAIQPSGGSGIDDYSVSGLPTGLSIDASTGAISGTPTAANTSTAAVTVTVEDTAGNSVDAAEVTFPAVAKGDQSLSGFQYSATSVSLDATVPSVTTPSGVETTLSYSASPATVCTVNATSGELTLVGAGECIVTATAASDTNWNQAAVTWTVTVQALGNLVLNVGTIADDNTVNIAEKAAGFAISGDTGTETGVEVTVAIGSASLTATSAEESGTATWSVNVPVAASYITGTSVAVTVSASKNGFTAPGDVTRTLTVDLTAPTVPTYSAPSSLQVGVAMTAIQPNGGSGIDGYSVSGLPAGLSIDQSTGAISGTPTTANTSTAAVTVTVEDTAGNAVDAAVVTFPVVAKGDQTLSGFQYSATSVSLDATVPSVTQPSGVETTLSYSASPSTVCTVNASSGALTLVGAGECVVTATAAGNANWNQAAVTWTVTVQALGNLVLNVGTIADDNTVNIAEKEAGFTISGNTGTEADVTVTVAIGSGSLTATSADPDATDNDTTATWSVNVPTDASYITGTSVTVSVSASKDGFTAPNDVTHTLTIDLTAPTAPSYTAPGSLQVGVAMTAIQPIGGSGIDGFSAAGLPAGLSIDPSTGVISGTPEAADTSTAAVTVTVEDTAGNSVDAAEVTYPAVAKGDQTLSGFQYSTAALTYGSTDPTVTTPTGTQTTLSYSASPPAVCTVNASTGELSILEAGSCLVTVTAASDANWNQAIATWTVTVQPAGALVLNLGTIAEDDTVNITEKAAGFAIAGDTGTEAGVAVTLAIGTTELNATSVDDSGTATWSVNVPAAASYITGASVEITVSASKVGYTAPGDVTRTLTVDLTAPTAPSYTAPGSLQVGVAMTAIQPIGGSGIDGYSAAGLPAGLSIDPSTGVISGTPEAADTSTAAVTVTVEDTAGNSVDAAEVTFPAVVKGDQTLSGFQYSTAALTYGSTAPTVTPPTGAQTTLSYSASPPAVCTVNASTGELSILEAGSCLVTVTAASDANWNQAIATWTVTVQPAGALVLNLGTIADDNTVNIAEKAAGFAIAGDTGTEAGVAVTLARILHE